MSGFADQFTVHPEDRSEALRAEAQMQRAFEKHLRAHPPIPRISITGRCDCPGCAPTRYRSKRIEPRADVAVAGNFMRFDAAASIAQDDKRLGAAQFSTETV